jgi:hypothetical protein
MYSGKIAVPPGGGGIVLVGEKFYFWVQFESPSKTSSEKIFLESTVTIYYNVLVVFFF